MIWRKAKNGSKKGSKRLLSGFFASLVIVGSLVTATVISQPSYAAPSDNKTKAECEKAKFEWKGTDDTGLCVDPEASSCGIEGIGWVLCPVMEFIGNAADMAFGFLADQFLSIKQEYVTSDTIKSAWGTMRTIANVAFVIGFMMIVYSQLTSAGISNYGVKKLLPRLIIAAILVNLSLYICQIAVDVSNLAGYGLKEVFSTIDNTVVTPAANPDENNAAAAGLGIAGLVALLLVGGVTLALSISGPVILAALLALLLIALILVARIALIVTLTVVSPLAFVAFLLPNTEQWFKKWYKMFGALLMVFPVIAVVFGASSLVATIITATAQADNSLMMQVVATGVATIPLFMVPGLLKNSMSAAGSLGTKLSNMASKQQSAAASKGRAKAGERYQRSRLADAQRGFNNRLALGRAKRRSKGLGAKLDQSKFGRALGLDKGAATAMAAVDKQDEQDVSQELTRFKNTNGATDLDGASKAMVAAIKSGDSVKARAMQRYLAGAGGAGVKALEKVYGGSSDSIRANGSLQQSLASDALGLGMKGKSAAIDSFSTDGKRSFNDIQQDQSTYTRLGAAELAGQKNLGQLMSDGIIDSNMAQAVMSSPDARDLMNVADRGTMAGLAGTDLSGNPLSAGGAGGSAPTPSSSGDGGGASGGGTPQISYESAPTTNINPSTGEVTTTSNFASGQEVMQQIHHASGHEGSATKKSLKAGVGNLSDAQLGELIQQAQTTPGAENDAHYQEVLKVARGEAGRRNGGPPPSSRP